MKCYQKAFALGNEFGNEEFENQFDMVDFYCPEQFFKDYNIEIAPSICTIEDIKLEENTGLADMMEVYERNKPLIEERNKRCRKCWSREFKEIKRGMNYVI